MVAGPGGAGYRAVIERVGRKRVHRWNVEGVAGRGWSCAAWSSRAGGFWFSRRGCGGAAALLPDYRDLFGDALEEVAGAALGDELEHRGAVADADPAQDVDAAVEEGWGPG